MSAVHICAPPTTWLRRVRWCPNCQQRRRFVVMCQEWYSPLFTCCACGDSWSDGSRMERPFARAWRPQAVRQAQKQWSDATPRSGEHAALVAMLGGET